MKMSVHSEAESQATFSLFCFEAPSDHSIFGNFFHRRYIVCKSGVQQRKQSEYCVVSNVWTGQFQDLLIRAHQKKRRHFSNPLKMNLASHRKFSICVSNHGAAFLPGTRNASIV